MKAEPMPWGVADRWHAAGWIHGGETSLHRRSRHIEQKEQAVAEGDERNYRGNDLAYILAKQAASWGSANIVEVVAALDIVEGWKHFYIYVGRMLNKWLPVWSKPVDRPIKEREARKQHEHTLTYTKDFDL